jgi:hypothetical protein
MTLNAMTLNQVRLIAAAFCAVGIVASIIGAVVDPSTFRRAWLCSYLFWLGVPLAGVALVLVHDLSGGEWMETARPVLDAAIVTMPLASLAGIIAFADIGTLYDWTHPTAGLGNTFYLNRTDFFIRYGIDVVLWNLLAAFALWGRREGKLPISPAQSWLSGLGLIALALSTAFAAIDWIMSLEPSFWSSIFPYVQSASWFNTGMAAVVLTVTLFGWPAADRRKHLADLSRILLATTIFWAYVEFMQFLIIWEQNLKSEIPWYLKRFSSVWQPAIDVSAGLGFVVPFFVLLWGPTKSNRIIVATVCIAILISRIANSWLLVLPEFSDPKPFWLDIATVAGLGGAVVLLFAWALPRQHRLAPAPEPSRTPGHG